MPLKFRIFCSSLVSKEVVQRTLQETEPLHIQTIAVHTFSVLVLHLQSGLKTALLVISVIWIFIALVIGIGMAAHKGQIYYGNTQYCGFLFFFLTQGDLKLL